MEQSDYFRYAIYYPEHTFSTSRLPSIGKTKNSHNHNKINKKTRLSIMMAKILKSATSMMKFSIFLNFSVQVLELIII